MFEEKKKKNKGRWESQFVVSSQTSLSWRGNERDFISYSYRDHSAEHPVEVVYDLVALKVQLIDAKLKINRFLWRTLP